MTTKGWTRAGTVLTVLGMLGAAAAHAQVLTAEGAVKVALEKSTQIINAEAGIKDAKGNLQGAYGGIVPNVSLSATRTLSQTEHAARSSFIGGRVVPDPLLDSRFKGTTPSVSGSWDILNLSNWKQVSAARSGMSSAKLSRNATRADVALAVRRQFYVVVQAIKLAQVATIAVQFARDDERRVKAMFEVGSVSKADLLRAQVRLAQSQMDELTNRHAVIVQRIELASQMGIKEAEMGEVDTVLVTEEQTYDEAGLLAEASKNRPDLMAADGELRAARASLAAARLARLPYVTARGQVTFETRSKTRNVPLPPWQDAAGNHVSSSEFTSEADRGHSAELAVQWDVFNMGAIDSRISSARARVDRSQEAYDAIQRNLASEVRQQILAYAEANEGKSVAQSGLESARENLKLTQEKYNVGSATILDLIDAQVQLQNAANDLVKALAAIRVVEAQIRRVRGQAE